MTLTATPPIMPATYHLQIQASDNVFTRTVTLTVTVAAALYDLYLPIGAR